MLQDEDDSQDEAAFMATRVVLCITISVITLYSFCMIDIIPSYQWLLIVVSFGLLYFDEVIDSYRRLKIVMFNKW